MNTFKKVILAVAVTSTLFAGSVFAADSAGEAQARRIGGQYGACLVTFEQVRRVHPVFVMDHLDISVSWDNTKERIRSYAESKGFKSDLEMADIMLLAVIPKGVEEINQGLRDFRARGHSSRLARLDAYVGHVESYMRSNCMSMTR